MKFTGEKEIDMYNQMCNKCEDHPCENMDGCEDAQGFLERWKPDRFTIEKIQELLKQCNNMVQMYGTDKVDERYQKMSTASMLNYGEVSRELCLEVLFYLGVEVEEIKIEDEMLDSL